MKAPHQALLVPALVMLLSSCTFYTACPNGNSGSNPSNGNNSSGGGESGGAGGDQPVTGAGAAALPTGTWANATGDLAGKKAGFGNLCYVAAKPDEDMLITGVSEQGLWKSSDGAETWEALGTGKGSPSMDNRASSITFDPADTSVFWVSATYGPGAFRTDDNGHTFTELGMIGHNDFLSIDLSDPDRKTLFAGGHEQGNVLYRSTDGGASFDDVSKNLPGGAAVCSYPFVIDADHILFACSEYGGGSVHGILRSADGGESWEQATKVAASQIPLLASDGTLYWPAESGSGLLVSTDQGETWTQPSTGNLLLVHPVELPDGRIATLRSDNAVIVSSDKGVSWIPVSSKAKFGPAGLAYSAFQGAFFVWHNGPDPVLPEDAIMRYDYDYQAE